MKQKIRILALMSILIITGVLLIVLPKQKQVDILPHVTAERKGFSVDVRATGELETANSTGIASSIRGDQAKLIYLAPDGADVAPGDLLVRIDPSPFEERVTKIQAQIK